MLEYSAVMLAVMLVSCSCHARVMLDSHYLEKFAIFRKKRSSPGPGLKKIRIFIKIGVRGDPSARKWFFASPDASAEASAQTSADASADASPEASGEAKNHFRADGSPRRPIFMKMRIFFKPGQGDGRFFCEKSLNFSKYWEPAKHITSISHAYHMHISMHIS